MNEKPPKTPEMSERTPTRSEELVALAKELSEHSEIFPFPGLEPETYAKLKATDKEFPGYTTPIDERLERLRSEGMKVVLGKYPESGNIFILPALSNDIENDMVSPKHLQVNDSLNVKLRELIEKSKRS